MRSVRTAIQLAFLFGQASVNESLETAFIWVDGTKGSDSNNGSKSSPLQTIGAAITMAQQNNLAGIGTRVTINPGTYRETLTVTHTSQNTALPITFQAATAGTVIISGSTLYTGWVSYSANRNIYTNSWPNQWGTCAQLTICPYQQDIMMRQEMVIVNGIPLTQVLSLGQMQQGTFFVDENAALIYIWPQNGTQISTATVEVPSQPTVLSVEGGTNLVFRGLTFQYANSCRASAAAQVEGNSNNILFDNDNFQWNNAQGLKITGGTFFTVQNSTARHNGESGFQDERNLNGWWQSDTASYNNWRGAQAGFYGCNTAGYHASLAHTITVNSLTSSFNETWGIHWDTDNANITATGLNATSNYLAGAFAEKDEGPITISNSYLCNQNSSGGQGGLMLRNSEQISISNSVLLNNSPAQIEVVGQAGGIEVTNWQTGVTSNLITQNFTSTRNVIQGNTSTQGVFSDSYLGNSDWTSFENTLVSSNNTWWNPLNALTEFMVPTPKNRSTLSFAGGKA
ncbi:MAG TPA: right-handed parallel beta-helix repeat-containing protein [Candidatus Sulfotelmatobacter sp.]|nr:right-handed parallel beta-helix repeat-containing protein [Candidatus Sulfotelmatobacter sp.]